MSSEGGFLWQFWKMPIVCTTLLYSAFFFLVKAQGYEYVLEPSPVPLPLDRPQETRVLQVSCGRAHSLVLTDSEGGKAVFSGGSVSLL